MLVAGEVIVHGVVNKALERFTIDKYGFGLWQKVVSACPHAVVFYEAMLCYPDQDSYGGEVAQIAEVALLRDLVVVRFVDPVDLHRV